MKSKDQIVSLLRAIGMHPKYKGYAYILYILSVTKSCPEYVYEMTSRLYPMTMKKFGTTMSGVDRNIGFVIKRTFEDGNEQVLARIFGTYNLSYVPTNAEFISVMTQIVCHCMLELSLE